VSQAYFSGNWVDIVDELSRLRPAVMRPDGAAAMPEHVGTTELARRAGASEGVDEWK